MKLLTTASLLLLTSITAVHSAGIDGIPQCAVTCFTKAVAKTSCSLFDFYCQCTKGAQAIQDAALPCICNDSTCTAAERTQVEQASNNICSSALAASSQTYTPTPLPSNVCQALATGSAGSNATGVATSTTMIAASSSTSNHAATASKMGVHGALLGAAGMVVLAL